MHLNELIVMGGYGIYVWPTYIITFFVFGVNLLLAFTEKRQVKKIIRQYLTKCANSS